ncbi:MAG: autotransporter outer membrane beta-barrel domain-containing protein [Pseudomonadota bacterium]
MNKQPHTIHPTWRRLLLAALAGSVPGSALAGLDDFVGTPLETAAADANQATFEALRDPNVPDRDVPLPGLSDEQVQVFSNVRELVHTFNELSGSGATEFSLGLDAEGLGFALRWTAAEELAAQGSLSTEIGKGQLAYLAGRLSQLRVGGGGVSIVGLPVSWDAGAYAANSTSAPGETMEAGTGFSRFSGFVNGSLGYGDKAPTDLEAAFDFDGGETIVGGDYRFSDSWVMGGSIGFSQAEIDFDSSQSIVDGGIETDALSLGLYGLFTGERFYADAALSYSAIDYDVTRRIVYPSLNPDIANTDETALSSTEGSQLALSTGMGYMGYVGRFSWEPFLRFDYLDTDIDGFTETNTSNGGFDLAVGDQGFSSLDGSAGLQLAMTFTPRQMVLVPFLRASYHREFDDDQRAVAAVYLNGEDPTFGSTQDFGVPTDPPDEDYYKIALGLSAVVRGGRVTRDDGVARGGIQLFVQYETIEDLDNYNNANITGGFRYEF